MTITTERTTTPACAEHDDLFQSPLLEEPALASSVELRRRQVLMTRKAESICLDCPLMVDCLYRAVAKHDVAGYCAGTTQRQRAEIRQHLGLRVDPEDFDTFAGANSGHQIDHDEVLRLRHARPNDSLESIAQRLGCSLSTVKRHLRKARRGEAVGRPAKLSSIVPTLEQVLNAYQQVVARARPSQPTRRAA
ncbi:hypothetical protein GCM10009785_12210 [Brooklawnia cerclae]|uniref:AraC-like DNA-binding protein n=1 Tax=Brooklawnia cerclae TaxID=349934 RepID=A0ABX0SMK1_9ACTN|nr:WhiB family transcriptional regulator [Brooklawnia cerclae]NIH58553.1 AraC-like DNA-binding protein [Brooklawnia cerclae]